MKRLALILLVVIFFCKNPVECELPIIYTITESVRMNCREPHYNKYRTARAFGTIEVYKDYVIVKGTDIWIGEIDKAIQLDYTIPIVDTLNLKDYDEWYKEWIKGIKYKDVYKTQISVRVFFASCNGIISNDLCSVVIYGLKGGN